MNMQVEEPSDLRVKSNSMMDDMLYSGLKKNFGRKSVIMGGATGVVKEESGKEDNTYDREYAEKYKTLMKSFEDFKPEVDNLRAEYRTIAEFMQLEWYKSMKNQKFANMMADLEIVVRIIEATYDEEGNLDRDKALNIKVGHGYLDRQLSGIFDPVTDEQIHKAFQATLAKTNSLKAIVEKLDSNLDEREISRIEEGITIEQALEGMEIDEDAKRMLQEEWHQKDSEVKFSLDDLQKVMKVSMLRNLSEQNDIRRSAPPFTNDNEERFLELLKQHDLDDFFNQNYSKYVPSNIMKMREMLRSSFYIANVKKQDLIVDYINLDDDDDDRSPELGEDTEKIHLNIHRSLLGISWTPVHIDDNIINKKPMAGYRKSLIPLMEQMRYDEVNEWIDKTEYLGRSDFMEEVVLYEKERMERRLPPFTPTWSEGIEHRGVKRAIDNLERAHNMYTSKLEEVEIEMAHPKPSPRNTFDIKSAQSELEEKYMGYSLKLREIDRRKKRLMSRIDIISGHTIESAAKHPLLGFVLPEEYTDKVIEKYNEEVEAGRLMPIEDTTNTVIMMEEMLSNPELSKEAKKSAEKVLKVAWAVLTQDLDVSSIFDGPTDEEPKGMVKYGVKEPTEEESS